MNDVFGRDHLTESEVVELAGWLAHECGPDVRPSVTQTVPVCSLSQCPSFDGKRCRVLGARPDYLCEPAVQALTLAVVRR